MKILFVSKTDVLSPNYGGEQRSNCIFNTLQSFAEMDALIFNKAKDNVTIPNNIHYCPYLGVHPIIRLLHTLLCLCFTPWRPNFEWHRNKHFAENYTKFVEEGSYDLVFVRGVSTYLMCAPKKQSNIIIDVDDAPAQVFYSTFKNSSEAIFRRLSHFYAYPFVKKFTKKILGNVKYALFSNEEDCLATNAVYLPNIPYTKTLTVQQHWKPNHNVLFIGKLSFPPNEEGIRHFVSYIWPKVSAVNSDARLYIAGKGLNGKLEQELKQDKSIQVLGFVEDLSELYSQCAIVVTPIFVGAGTNIKLLEALYMKKICVASSFSMKGFRNYFKDSTDLFVADNDDEYINKLNYTLTNIDTLECMAQNGRDIISRQFSEERLKNTLKHVVD